MRALTALIAALGNVFSLRGADTRMGGILSKAGVLSQRSGTTSSPGKYTLPFLPVVLVSAGKEHLVDVAVNAGVVQTHEAANKGRLPCVAYFERSPKNSPLEVKRERSGSAAREMHGLPEKRTMKRTAD